MAPDEMPDPCGGRVTAADPLAVIEDRLEESRLKYALQRVAITLGRLGDAGDDPVVRANVLRDEIDLELIAFACLGHPGRENGPGEGPFSEWVDRYAAQADVTPPRSRRC